MAWNDGLLEGTPAHNLASSTSKTIRAVAGPGSGKSFAIKRRIARLLEEGMKPEDILAITFTRTAAQDLKREISSIGIKGADEVHSRTLHSHALKILMHEEVLQSTERTPRMAIPHEMAAALRDLNDEDFGSVTEKKKLMAEYLAAWASLQSDDPGFTKDRIQESFEEGIIDWLKSHDALMVGEVIPVAINFLRYNPTSIAIGEYKVILVDEYQDLNKSEQEFILLIRQDAELVIVGDDDQSIYSFKYAHPEGIQELEDVYGAYDDIAFDVCRRCPQQVTRMASTLIAKNPNRTLGDLNPLASNSEGIVQIVQWNTYGDEITGLTKIIGDAIDAGDVETGDVLVLTPRRRVGYRLRDSLTAAGYTVKSSFREDAIKKEGVQRAYSLLNLLAHPNDKLSLRYLLGFGSSNFRNKQYMVLQNTARDNGLSLRQTLDAILDGRIGKGKMGRLVEEYEDIVEDLRELKEDILDNPMEALQDFFVETADDAFEFYELDALYRKAIEETGIDALTEHPEEFDNWFGEVFANLQENITLPEPPEVIDHIRIMSLHASKGLSAKFVVLCATVDPLLPYLSTGLTEDEKKHQIEEQRRLFYVAITRCKATGEYPGRLIISSFASIYGVEALQMGISANPKTYLSVLATRYLKDFGRTAPASVAGHTLL